MTSNTEPMASDSEKARIGFAIVGAQKCGTSALHGYLKKHPEIGMPRRKELHFFDRDSLFEVGEPTRARYEAEFDFTQGSKIYGEITPVYMFWEPCMRRIRDYNPAMKLIACLRNPAERAYSQWNMLTKRDRESKSFSQCLQREKAGRGAPRKAYVARGFYAAQIRRIFEHFPREQVLLLKYEDFLAEQERHLGEIFDFLGVDRRKFNYRHQRVYALDYASAMEIECRRKLVASYRSDIEEVEALLGWDCSDWKAIPASQPAPMAQ